MRTVQTRHDDPAKNVDRRPNAFQVVGINLDNERERALSALEQTTAKWPHIFDGEGFRERSRGRLGVLSVPVTILIDKDGVVAMSGSHFSSDMETKLEEMLASSRGTPNQAANAKPAPNIPTNARVNGATNNKSTAPHLLPVIKNLQHSQLKASHLRTSLLANRSFGSLM